MHTAGIQPEPREEATTHGRPLGGMSIVPLSCADVVGVPLARRNSTCCLAAIQDHGDIVREPAQTALYTIIRDQDTSRGDSLFYSDRIIRLLVEEELNHLAVVKRTVTTPTGMTYEGVDFEGKICGMSILRAGENTISRLEASLTKDMVYFAPLSGLEVTSGAALGLVPKDT
ncbi:uracil phosphoribosyltransferase-domain-containing protein [Armillaria luteobubalina]|uniref:Uracil phosphoribosyltransferase-domain-containing protein n=1 Tax=Armillaria luteobubalina TaxID=153913 RepID=A0AA39T9H7_9AGAR|nr:uracil phosphoribosyltransferase-domain-containing protein [Armillaria luteobubalina]